MACENLNPFDPKLPNQLAQVALDGIVGAIAGAGLTQIKRAYVGVGPVPAEDCCPDIVVWISNIRLWDGVAPDTLTENRVLEHGWGVAFNINARIGDCFWELVPGTTRPEPAANITQMSESINAYGFAGFLGAVQALSALDTCNASVHPQNADPFQDGGCAGFIFTIGVGVI